MNGADPTPASPPGPDHAPVVVQWAGDYRELLKAGSGPSIHDHLGVVPVEARTAVAYYLEGGAHIGAVPGLERSVLGDSDVWLECNLLSDGQYVWRGWLAYYVLKYGVAVPEDLVARAVAGVRPDHELAPEEWARVKAWLEVQNAQEAMW